MLTPVHTILESAGGVSHSRNHSIEILILVHLGLSSIIKLASTFVDFNEHSIFKTLNSNVSFWESGTR